MTARPLPPASLAALRALAALHESCADPARLRLLNLLAAGELCVCDLVELSAQSQPFVSRHLARLRAAGVVDVRRSGRFAYYRISPTLAPPLAEQLAAVLASLAASSASLRAERRAALGAVRRRDAMPCA